MKYRFYHEWIYRVSIWMVTFHNRLADFHVNCAYKYIEIMKKMTDRPKRSREVIEE